MRLLLAILLSGLLTGIAFTQQRSGASRTIGPINCRTCHSSATPTKVKPALKDCPRVMVRGYHSIKDAPRTVILNKNGKRFGEVTFSHNEHAHMSEMSEGCASCHHYNAASPIQPCRSCHPENRIRENLSVPDLLAAQHRRCIGCHGEWGGPSDCNFCHQPKSSSVKSAAQRTTVTKVTEPIKIVYETGADAGNMVTFIHEDHSKRFGLNCTDCHQNQSCSTCHNVRKATAGAQPATADAVKPKRSFDEAHQNCSGCHENRDCGYCHADNERVAFNHARATGWALNKFHVDLNCRDCHKKEGAFTKLNTDCESCHRGWRQSFDHVKTGQSLDEVHAALDCETCHLEGNFDKKPDCVSCHEGYTYPAKRPGPTAKAKRTAK